MPAAAKARQIACTRSMELIAGDRLKVQEVLTLTGADANSMRNFARSSEKQSRERYLDAMLTRNVGQAVLGNWSFHGVEESGDIRVEMNYEVDNHCHRVDDQLIIRAPGVWDKVYLEEKALKQRQTPFQLQTGVELEISVTLKMPDGCTASPQEAGGNTGKFMQWTQTPAGASWTFSGQRKTGQYSAADYPLLVAETTAAIKAIQQSIALRR
jgi:hypothetical protein